MLRRVFLFAVLGLALSACVSVPPHDLAVTEFQQYRIADVAVEGVEAIRSWPGEEEAFLRTNAVDPGTASRMQTEPASQFPQLRAHFQKVPTARLRAEFASLTDPVFTGRRPLVAVVRLREFDVPSTARRVFVDSQAKIKAEIDLVDKATGRVVLRYEGRWEGKKLVGGLLTGVALALDRSDVGYSMMTDYLTAYRNWLLRN